MSTVQNLPKCMQLPPEDDRIWPKYVEEDSSSNFYVFYLFLCCVCDFYKVSCLLLLLLFI